MTNNFSTTTYTRIVAALPSKAWVLLYDLLENHTTRSGQSAINQLGRALVIDWLLQIDGVSDLFTQDEIAKLKKLSTFPLTLPPEQAIEHFKKRSQSQGQNSSDFDPASPSYFVRSFSDLLKVVDQM
jgi:hypothetical protein